MPECFDCTAHCAYTAHSVWAFQFGKICNYKTSWSIYLAANTTLINLELYLDAAVLRLLSQEADWQGTTPNSTYYIIYRYILTTDTNSLQGTFVYQRRTTIHFWLNYMYITGVIITFPPWIYCMYGCMHIRKRNEGNVCGGSNMTYGSPLYRGYFLSFEHSFWTKWNLGFPFVFA